MIAASATGNPRFGVLVYSLGRSGALGSNQLTPALRSPHKARSTRRAMAESTAASGCVLGVNFAAQIAYLVAVTHELLPLLDAPLKIVPPENLDEWSRLEVFGRRLADEAKAIHAQRVAFALPRKPSNWVYSDARARAALETAAGLALRSAGIPAEAINQRTVAAGLGIGPAKDFEERDRLAASLKIKTSSVQHWDHRAPALAVALHLARKLWR
jgi:hypothetical protein